MIHTRQNQFNLQLPSFSKPKDYVDEIFGGLDYAKFPKITQIENKMKRMLIDLVGLLLDINYC